MKRTRFAFILLGLACSVTAACSSVEERLALADVGGDCYLNSDCADLLVCVFGRCHVACVKSRDCRGAAHCVQTDQERNVCQLPDEQACEPGTACPGAQVCAVDGECRDACRSDRECLAEQACSAGACAEESELDAQGLLPPASERPVTLPCVFDSDCPGTDRCRAGACRLECAAPADCPTGWSCAEGTCSEPEPATPQCLRSSDCPERQHCLEGKCYDDAEEPEPECSYASDCPRAGQSCVDGICTCECSTDVDCPSPWSCLDGCACVPNGVVHGSLTIVNEVQLRALEGVRKIDGELTLGIGVPGEYHVPDVREVGGIRVNTRFSYVFDALTTVNGDFTSYGDSSAPLLTTVSGTMFVNSTREGLGAVEYPALVSTGSLSISSQIVSAVSLPSLTTVTENLSLLGNPRLWSFYAPLLHSVKRVDISQSPRIARFETPLLAPSQALSWESGSELSTLRLPNIGSLPSLSISGGKLLTLLELSGLGEVGTLSLSGMPSLSQLDLGTPTKIDSFSLQSLGLTALPNLGAALKEASSIRITSNAQLSECAAKAFDDRITDPPGYYTQSGNQPCSCGGPSCCLGSACGCEEQCP